MTAPQFEYAIKDLLPGHAGGGLAVSSLLQQLVVATCRANEERARNRCSIHPISIEQLLGQLANGRAGVSDRPPPKPIKVEEAIVDVTDAFRDGLILLFVDGERCTDLDAMLTIHPESRVMLVRRTMLRG